MKKIFTLALLCLATASFLSAQTPAIELKLQLLPDGESWGVFAKPKSNISPSLTTITGSATVIMVTPTGFQWSNLVNHAGTWIQTSDMENPIENPGFHYWAFGLVEDFPKIQYISGQETLLFSFESNAPCADTLYLMDNENDPIFNSWYCQIGQNFCQFDVVDFGKPGTPIYWYSHLYAPSAWSCHDNDGDGILNAHEDTNGNGKYDQGSDASNLNGGPYKALDLKLQLMPDGNTWGVYVKPDSFISPSTNTITGSAQVTVVMPVGYQWNSLVSHAGTWTQNATAINPAENPGRTYTSFGLVTYLPQINYVSGQETLLFTFKGTSPCPDTMYLIDNENDPFADLPNSYNSNPGNEISVLDTGTIDWKVYYYSGNYAPSAWSCHDCDGDGIPDALEDTNGDGAWTPGVDVSDICGSCNFVSISSHPVDAIVCDGKEAFFVSKAFNTQPGSFFKAWQVSVDNGISWTNIQNIPGGVYHNIAGASFGSDTLAILGLAGLHGYQYRCCYTVSNCSEKICSEPATLNLDHHLTLIDEPDNATSCSGNGVTMQATIVNTGTGTISYQWEQSCDFGLTWMDVMAGGVNGYEGINSNELIINDVVGLDSCWFRLRYSSGGCGEKWSNYALVTVQGPLSIVTQPVASDTICSGTWACFSVQAVNENSGPIYYQWQAKYANASAWTNLNNNATFSGVKTPNFCISNVAGLDQAQFRVLIQTNTCSPVVSETVLLRVSQLIITQNPYDWTICSGEAVSFTSMATNVISSQNPGSNIEHQWQVSTDNGLFWSVIDSTTDGGVYSNFDTSTLNVSDVTGLYGRSYRLCFKANGCSEVYSTKAKLKISGPISIINQPEDYSTCGNGYLFLSAGVLNESIDYPNDGLFKWQESKDNGLTWHSLDDNITYGGTETDSLLITDVSGKNNYRYRLLYWTNVCDTVISQSATIHTTGSLIITSQPESIEICSGEQAAFSVSAENPDGNTFIEYRWEFSDNGIVWENALSFSNALIINNVNGLNNRKYRCKMRLPGCDWLNSDIATLTVIGINSVSQHPLDVTNCPDKKALFYAKIQIPAGTPDIQYQWQQSTNNGATWNNLTNGLSSQNMIDGSQTDTLVIAPLTGLHGTQYRMAAWMEGCDTVFSNAALLQLDDALCPVKKCVQLKLEYQPAKANWAVKLRAQPGSPVTTGNVLTSASITLVAPQNFDYQNFTSKKGVWELSGTLENPAENPGMKYLTFELQPGAASLNLGPWTETTLFTFKKMGDCPDSLYLMNGMTPQGLEPNEIKGHGQSNGQTHSIQLCGVYDLAAWSCLSPAPPDDLPIDTEIMLQFVRDNKTATGQALEKQKITTTGEPARFSVSPNPATDWLDISFENNRPEAPATLRLLNLQGRSLRRESLPESGQLRLDLTVLPPGIYFLSLEVNGKVVQREKVVKF